MIEKLCGIDNAWGRRSKVDIDGRDAVRGQNQVARFEVTMLTAV